MRASRELLRAFFDDPHSLLAEAIDGGVVVGMASGLVHSHPDKPPQFFVNEVGGTPGHQRRSLGRELVGCLLARGREFGCAEAWVATEEENVAARWLFAVTGGREESYRAVVFTYALWGDDAGVDEPDAAPGAIARPGGSSRARGAAAPSGSVAKLTDGRSVDPTR